MHPLLGSKDSPAGLTPREWSGHRDHSHVGVCFGVGLGLVEQLVCLVPTCFIYTVYDDQDLLRVHGPVLLGVSFYLVLQITTNVPSVQADGEGLEVVLNSV